MASRVNGHASQIKLDLRGTNIITSRKDLEAKVNTVFNDVFCSKLKLSFFQQFFKLRRMEGGLREDVEFLTTHGDKLLVNFAEVLKVAQPILYPPPPTPPPQLHPHSTSTRSPVTTHAFHSRSSEHRSPFTAPSSRPRIQARRSSPSVHNTFQVRVQSNLLTLDRTMLERRLNHFFYHEASDSAFMDSDFEGQFFALLDNNTIYDFYGTKANGETACFRAPFKEVLRLAQPHFFPNSLNSLPYSRTEIRPARGHHSGRPHVETRPVRGHHSGRPHVETRPVRGHHSGRSHVETRPPRTASHLTKNNIFLMWSSLHERFQEIILTLELSILVNWALEKQKAGMYCVQDNGAFKVSYQRPRHYVSIRAELKPLYPDPDFSFPLETPDGIYDLTQDQTTLLDKICEMQAQGLNIIRHSNGGYLFDGPTR